MESAGLNNSPIQLAVKEEFSIDENPFVCKIENEETHCNDIKKEIKYEHNEEIIKNDYELFNTEFLHARRICVSLLSIYITFDEYSITTHKEIHGYKVINFRIVNKPTKIKEKPYKCNLCNYRTNRSNNLKGHSYKHFGNYPFNCNECDYKTYAKSLFIRHSRIHTDEKPYECKLCDYRCNDLCNLRAHMYKHSNDPTFRCDYKTRYVTGFNQHETIRNEKKAHSGKCDYKEMLNNGVTTQQPFICSVCNLSFLRSRALKVHYYKHSNDWPFSCDKCDYKTHAKYMLVKHNRTHTGEKLFGCDMCDYRCNRLDYLRVHTYKHSGLNKSTEVTGIVSEQPDEDA
ncbi:hypothetical protein FQR65_LT09815 [Abscondita terminalis]|nr:hypothetical protein FQR65_LT09815 [Abscondita terminalis]